MVIPDFSWGGSPSSRHAFPSRERRCLASAGDHTHVGGEIDIGLAHATANASIAGVPRVAPQIDVQRSCAHPDVEAAPEESAQIESAFAGSNSNRKIHARIIVELELLFIFRIACVHSVPGRRLNGQSWWSPETLCRTSGFRAGRS
jgi:hypothetical protein